MKEVIGKLFERSSIVLILLGVVLFLIGAAEKIAISTFLLEITGLFWRVAISIIGFALAVLGVFLLLKENLVKGDKSSSGKEHSMTSSKSILFDNNPKLITGSKKDSAIVLDSSLLQNRAGTIMFWVFLNNENQGIRELINNRYLVSHATEAGGPYRQVFSLSLGPKSYNPVADRLWKLWLKGENNTEKVWEIPDSLSLGQGWSHITIRWDFDRYNKIEIILNGNVIITGDSPHQYWPTEFSPHLYFGTWPSRNSIHYIETSLARIRMTKRWESDIDIQNELLNNNPESSNT